MKVLYWSDENPVTRENVKALNERYGKLEADNLLKIMMSVEMPERLVLVSSFGTESAILLDMVGEIDKKFPIVFLNTRQLFAETLRYRDQLVEHIGLENVKTVEPSPVEIKRYDRDGKLWEVNPDDCCHMRKVLPLEEAINGYDGWISGRKRYHGGARANLPLIELSSGKIKINPLAKWTPDRVMHTFAERGLPQHPLVEKGYTSVGCEPCTAMPDCASQARSGRWKGQDKSECGIHIDDSGNVRRIRRVA